MTQQQPYFSIFSLVMRDHLATVSNEALRVFLLLGTYIDSRGWCYPGMKELSDRTGYRQEDVAKFLDELASLKWIRYVRRNERDPLTGHKKPNVYELHPALVSVRTPVDETSEADATRSKTEGETGSSLIQEQPEHRIKPDPELPETLDHNQQQNQNQLTNVIYPDSSNQQQQTNPASKPADPRDLGSETETTESFVQHSLPLPSFPPAPDSAKLGKPERERQPRSAAPNGARTLTPQPPAPAAESLSEYANPLPDGEAETLVDAVCASTGNMPVRDARRLVSKHGVRAVRAGLNYMLTRENVRNPAGFLLSLFERQVIDADRDNSMRKPDSATERLHQHFDDKPRRRIASDPNDFIQR